MLGLLALPVAWLLVTRQSPVLAVDPNPSRMLVDGLGQRVVALGRTLASEWLIAPVVCLGAAFALAVHQRGARALWLRSYHVFSCFALTAVYVYLLLFDPFSPENPRASFTCCSGASWRGGRHRCSRGARPG
jgi:hypothetical protein